MKIFSIYDSVTGDVIGVGAVANDSDAPLQSRPGVSIMPDVHLDREKQKVDLSAAKPRVIVKISNDPDPKN